MIWGFVMTSAIEMTNTIKPILEKGKKFVCVKHNTYDPEIEDIYYEQKVIGDTVLQGVKCTAMQIYYYETGEKYDSFYLEEEGRLYLLMEGLNNTPVRYPMVDMSRQPGDTVARYLYDAISNSFIDADLSKIVIDADSIDVRGYKRKRLIFNDTLGNGKGTYWVEGIGSSNSFYQYLFPVSLCARPAFFECYLDDKLIFTCDDFYAPGFTNLSNDQAMNTLSGEFIVVDGNVLSICDDSTDVEIYTAGGTRICVIRNGESKTLPSGIYIACTKNASQKLVIR